MIFIKPLRTILFLLSLSFCLCLCVPLPHHLAEQGILFQNLESANHTRANSGSFLLGNRLHIIVTLVQTCQYLQLLISLFMSPYSVEPAGLLLLRMTPCISSRRSTPHCAIAYSDSSSESISVVNHPNGTTWLSGIANTLHCPVSNITCLNGRGSRGRRGEWRVEKGDG
ncbi:hypothetical protein BT67DRAFT_289685 [Trichocladium antarcticum]|uniref:Uncharacterized protein n=1 Tax=Trichocladium antarcticum TaxID=1450529 RepID=A0AAN6UL57_9PEZI|nr:hypothetical protein BT67DRAFT_289685 [Trichocladium antarcticum]